MYVCSMEISLLNHSYKSLLFQGLQDTSGIVQKFLWVSKRHKRKKLDGWGRKVDLVGGGMMNMIKTHCVKCSKNQKAF